jgi:hypothetical protein
MTVLPYDTTTMENYTAGVLLLPAGSRQIVARTLTITADIAVSDKVMSVTSSVVGTELKAGSSLSIVDPASPASRKHVLITEDVSVGTSPTDVSISASKYAIGDGSTARMVVGLIPLFGIQEFPFQGQTTTVDTTNTLSGTGTEKKAVRADRTIQYSGVETKYATAEGGDKGLQLLKETQRTSQLFGRELYFFAVYPDGQVIEAAIIVTDLNEPGSYNEVKKYSFTAHLQGDSFQWTSPYASVGY